MALPNYLHVGQPKAGSTTLHFILKQNAHVCLVPSKEAHFFDTPEAYAKGLRFYQDQFFSHYSGQRIVGDITPAYFKLEALERIAEALGPDIKISVCFRHPVARSLSHYFHDVRLLRHLRSFSEVMHKSRSFVDPSMGGRILQALYRLFPKENVQVLIFERDINGEQMHRTYPRLCQFLGIDAEPINLLEKSGIGFLPRITVAPRSGQVRDFRGRHEVRKGDVVVETLQETRFYRADVLTGLTDADRTAYETFYDGTTRSLARDEVLEIEREFFQEDMARLKELLGDDIPEWNIDRLHFKAPPMLETRLFQKSGRHASVGAFGRAVSRLGRILGSGR